MFQTFPNHLDLVTRFPWESDHLQMARHVFCTGTAQTKQTNFANNCCDAGPWARFPTEWVSLSGVSFFFWGGATLLTLAWHYTFLGFPSDDRRSLGCKWPKISSLKRGLFAKLKWRLLMPQWYFKLYKCRFLFLQHLTFGYVHTGVRKLYWSNGSTLNWHVRSRPVLHV